MDRNQVQATTMLENVQLARLERLWDRQGRRQLREQSLHDSEDQNESPELWETEYERSQQTAWQERRSYTLIDKSIPDFAQPFADKISILGLTIPESLQSQLCHSCNYILTNGADKWEWWNSKASCRCCQLIPQLAAQLDWNPRGDVRLTRMEIYFLLLREWLVDCDLNHKNHAPVLSPNCVLPLLPTRVLDIRNQNMIYLRCTKKERGKYIALSHCWGKAKTFSTTRENLDELCKGITFDKLPKSFQDAVEVTQKLGITFLWIDSLCIVQDDVKDWDRESARMESVFAGAYCTIAATSANNCHEGFLRRASLRVSSCLPDGKFEDGVDVHVSRARDNFESDVESGILNQRAWVYQERALSRRIIHFAQDQTYWECGSVIRSGTLTDSFKDLNWLGDSNFPETASHLLAKISNSMYEDIFTQYSRLGITVPEDRPIAIGGLESRLAYFYKTQSMYGILKCFLHTSLLWQRSGNEPLQRIDFKGKKVPSWSWMAYSGAIRYGAWRDWYQRVAQWNRDLKLDTKSHSMKAPLAGTLQDCNIERLPDDPNCQLKDVNGKLVGWIKFDQDIEHHVGEIGCVVIGKDRYGWEKYAGVSLKLELGIHEFCYVLVVSPTPTMIKLKNAYQRLGIGVVREQILLDEKEHREIYIV